MKISRRDFITLSATGIAAAAVGTFTVTKIASQFAVGSGVTRSFRLAFTEAQAQMIDGKLVYHWAFQDLNSAQSSPRLPGPLLETTEGDRIDLTLVNNLPDAHGFAIPGVPGVIGAGIQLAPGETQNISFTAPAGGSYMYMDHLNAPVNRVLGLHGPMVVLPRTGNTPYSHPTPNVQKLFNDLGTASHFPGEPWRPEWANIWLFSSIDPKFNAIVEKGQAVSVVDFKENFLPRYFTINGESGAFASHNHDTTPHGRIGQPHLIRIMNAGNNTDSPHIHGNHIFLLSRINDHGENVIAENVLSLDTHMIEPLMRMDWLLPFIRPPDIPGDPSIPLRELLKEELALTLGGVGQSPLAYPMHGHLELSQTAAGGNYPQGLVTHWEITGDLDGVDFPKSNPSDKGGKNSEHTGGQHGNS